MSPLPDATATELHAENTALRELLEVYEATSVEQAQKLGRALDALADNSRRLLEAERERTLLAEAQAKRLEREVEIAAQIQTSILPRTCRVEGFDISASMVPAEQVGGDYFDILPTENGCWLGIGDVSGHGLTAGLIMLMTQCAVMTLVRRDPTVTPTEAISVVNEVLFENIRQRLRQDNHMTLTLLHLESTGKLRFAGAHEELLLLRAGATKAEWRQTRGTWVGGRTEIGDVTIDSTEELAQGDTLVLYSDGIIEAQAPASGERFGLDRLADIVIGGAKKSSAELCQDIQRVVATWSPTSDDDRTAVVIRRRGLSSPP